MTTSLVTAFGRMFRGLSRGCLSDLVVVRLLGFTTLAGILAALAMLALGPPGDLAPFHLQALSDPDKQAEMFGQWGQLGLEDRVQAFFLVDALALVPLLLVGLLALGIRLSHLHHLDHPGEQGRLVKTAAWLFAALAIAAFVFAEAGDVAFLWGGNRPAWLSAGHWLFTFRVAACAVIVISASLAFSGWYFMAGRNKADNAVRDRARLRAGVADIMWRSKYAAAVVAAFGALAIGMDQTRDALIRQSTDSANSTMTSTTLGYLITTLAILALAFASWLWPRKIIRLKTPGRDICPTAQELAFAKWWCRILGLLPFLIVGVVLSLTIREPPPTSAALSGLARFALANVLLALLFLTSIVYRNRDNDEPRYYLGADDSDSARIDMAIRSVIVACGGPVIFLAARFCSLMGWAPPLALAVIASGLAAWSAVLGWIAYQSRRNGVPYLLSVLVIVALLGIFGYAEVHTVRVDLGVVDVPSFLSRWQFAWTIFLAIPCLWIAWWLTSREPTLGNLAFALGIVAVTVVVVLAVHDRRPVTVALQGRPSLEDATVDWLNELQLSSQDKETPQAVYLISAEGGGIRSAYWTAMVLARLKSLDPQFDRRTLSISAVSGGALGVAAFRACELGSEAPTSLHKCIRDFGATDFWTQLLGGALFEDALGSVVPTSLFCKSPGCGVLGRSYWFEGIMEESLPAMARGLATSARERRLPHLFLTTTRVETGERWLQSDVAVNFEAFPGACDVLAMIGFDIRLSTAAHNSSRFPYTNPVGALFAGPCDRTQPAGTVLRARLQDGGYFDDSATSTSSDVLRMLRRCLHGLCKKKVNDPESLRRLRPVVITIRNEDRFNVHLACDKRDPARPQEQPPLRLLPSILSAADTLIQTRLAHMHASEAQLEAEAELLRLERQDVAALASSSPASASSAPPLAGSAGPCIPFREWTEQQSSHRFDLLVDASLYPSGWVLSRAAMDGIDAQVELHVGEDPSTRSKR
jgi:hypothetical protein